MILTITSSFSSGVWSRGTITSALVKFCSSFTWEGREGSEQGKAPVPPKAYTWAVEEGLGIQGEGLSIRGVKEAGRLKFQKAD